MTEWISWINLISIVPSVAHVQFLGIIDSMVDSRILLTGEMLFIWLIWIGDWQFSTRIDITEKDLSECLSHSFSSIEIDENCIDILIPWSCDRSARGCQNDNGLFSISFIVSTPSLDSFDFLLIKLRFMALGRSHISKNNRGVIFFFFNLDYS